MSVGALLAILLLVGLPCRTDARWLAQMRFLSVKLRAGANVNEFDASLLPPALAADAVSVAFGVGLTDNFGLALGPKLVESGYPVHYAGRGDTWWEPYPIDILPVYLYGVVGGRGEQGWKHPTIEAYAGAGVAIRKWADPLPYFRVGARAEWAFGLLHPGVEVEWADVGPQLGAGLAIGGWHWLGE
jgi:hypothetical protein